LDLLILEHFFTDIRDEAQLVNIQLYLVAVIFEATKYTECMTNLHAVLSQPLPHSTLPSTALISLLVEVIEPQHTREDTCTIINSEKVLIVLLDVKHDSSSHLHLGK
jgi:hypothetical protein